MVFFRAAGRTSILDRAYRPRPCDHASLRLPRPLHGRRGEDSRRAAPAWRRRPPSKRRVAGSSPAGVASPRTAGEPVVCLSPGQIPRHRCDNSRALQPPRRPSRDPYTQRILSSGRRRREASAAQAAQTAPGGLQNARCGRLTGWRDAILAPQRRDCGRKPGLAGLVASRERRMDPSRSATREHPFQTVSLQRAARTATPPRAIQRRERRAAGRGRPLARSPR